MPDDDEILDPNGPSENDRDLLSDDDIASVLEGATLDDDDSTSEPVPTPPGDKDDLSSISASEDGGSDMSGQSDEGGIDTPINLAAGTTDILIRENGVRVAPGSNIVVEAYDFANPHFLSETQMRRVRLRHEQFIFNAASRLSMQLQTDFGLRMSGLETQPYQYFTDHISDPSHIALFRLNQLKGVGVIAMGARLAMTIVGRLLGGGEQSVDQERFLSDLEIVLLEDFLQLLLQQWCDQWVDFEKLHAEIVGYENHGRFLQTAPRDAQMLILSIDAVLGDCSETIQFGVPYFSIEPIIRKMQMKADANNQPAGSRTGRNWWASCDDIQVEVKAEWKAFECTVKDLLHLRPGDVLKLPSDLIGKTEIWCNNVRRFTGKVGTRNNRVAVEVTSKFIPEQKSLL